MGNVRTWRYVAVALLLFAAVDVLVPGFCAVNAEQPQVVARGPDGMAVADVELAGQHDDCFCCCSHVIPGLRQSLGPQRSLVVDVPHMPTGRADLSPAPLYHPPRAV